MAKSYSPSPWPGPSNTSVAMPRARIGVLVGLGLLLAGVEPAGEHQHRRLLDAFGLAQDAGEPLAFVRHLDALALRLEIGQREVAAFDRLHVRGLHLREVLHEQELAEMVVDAGALQMLGGGDGFLVGERGAAELLVHGGARRPGAAPVVPGFERRGDVLEIGQHHALGDEARRPMMDRGGDAGIGRGDAGRHGGVSYRGE